MELDLTNIKQGFKNKKLQKNFGFIFEHMDTSVITGKAYLPVMISGFCRLLPEVTVLIPRL